MSDTIKPIEIKRHIFERLRVANHCIVDAACMRTAEVEIIQSVIGDQLAFNFGLFIVGKQFQVDVPATWFQHLKFQYFPAWYKRYWPVVTKTIHTVKFCPHLDSSLSKSNHIEFLEYPPLSMKDIFST